MFSIHRIVFKYENNLRKCTLLNLKSISVHKFDLIKFKFNFILNKSSINEFLD